MNQCSARTTEARTILQELEALAAQQYVPPSAIALIYFGLDDKQTAHAWLEKAYLEYDVNLFLPAERGLAKPRSDPNFHDVFSRVGLVR